MNEIAARHLVRIHIDRVVYESPTPTTGVALYALADIPAHRELFLVVGGDREDELIPRDETEVHLKEDVHLYSQKVIQVIVNAEAHEVAETRLTFDEVVKLGYPVPPPGQNIMYTVKYSRGPRVNPAGTLVQGESVRIKNEMVFDVTPTDRS